MPESEPFQWNLDLSWVEDGEGQLVVSGCASVPKPDNENEVVTKEAIETALPDFMQLAVLHLDHTERPVGVITEAWFEGDKFMIKSPIKPTPDTADVRTRIKSGELAQFSIFGRRLKGSSSCRLNPAHRSETCQTLSLFLDSVSICPKGNAINPNSYLEVEGGGIVKATNAESALIHTTADGGQENKTMDDANDPAPAGSDDNIQQQILDTVRGIDARLTDLEQKYDELTSVDPEDIAKADEDGADETAAPETGDQPGVDDYLSAIGDALQTLAQMMQEVLKRLDNEPEDDGFENPPDDVEKGCVKKAETPAEPEIPDVVKKALDELKQENDLLKKSLCEIKKSVKPRVEVPVPPVTDEVKKATSGESGDVGTVGIMTGLLG